MANVSRAISQRFALVNRISEEVRNHNFVLPKHLARRTKKPSMQNPLAPEEKRILPRPVAEHAGKTPATGILRATRFIPAIFDRSITERQRT
jgi:hypothetical protein